MRSPNLSSVAHQLDPASDAAPASLTRPPGPSLMKLGLIAAQHANHWYSLLPALAKRYGDVVDIPTPVPGATVTLVSHPRHVDHIMTRHHHRYGKHEATNQLVLGEPPALPLLAGEEWKRTRRPLNPHFGEQALAGVTPAMAQGITERVDAWATRAGRWVDLEHELGAVVMDGLMRSMFSACAAIIPLTRESAAAEIARPRIVTRKRSFPCVASQWSSASWLTGVKRTCRHSVCAFSLNAALSGAKSLPSGNSISSPSASVSCTTACPMSSTQARASARMPVSSLVSPA